MIKTLGGPGRARPSALQDTYGSTLAGRDAQYRDVTAAGVWALGLALCLLLAGGFAQSARAQGSMDWEPAESPLMSRWADEVSPASVRNRPYPRPQMKRAAWKTLNGLWDYALTGTSQEQQPATYDGQILVPFPIEAALSGVGKRVGSDQRLWYRRQFTVPAGWQDRRVLLHFGAVDWRATVFVNGQRVGRHDGGYDPFTFEITGALSGSGPQELVVKVYDPTSAGPHARGKQVRNPGGIWYTPATGIWQTVWLEPVPSEGSIQDLKMIPKIEDEILQVAVEGRDAEGLGVEVVAKTNEGEVLGRATGAVGAPIAVPVSGTKLWSPSHPHLYDLDVRLVTDGGEVVDRVDSYFGMRSIGLGEGAEGETRITLNGEVLFQYGPLDQGYWPGGLYTAPTIEALAYDLEMTKQLGFNMTRKHVKVEPRRWYYLADSLGLLVWQDMPSAIAGPGPTVEHTAASQKQFEKELRELVDDHYNHPSIVTWVVFNEGWGQYDTQRLTGMVEEMDPTRLAINASGWTDKGVGDIRDVHVYPGPGAPPAEEDRAIVLGEFGGLGLPIPTHTWQSQQNWGYRSYDNPAALTEAYLDQLAELRVLIDEPGLAAAIYTQITDVEIEVNGLMTYDRDVIKMNTYRIAKANRRLYEGPPPEVTMILPTAQQEAGMWRYTTNAPGEGWIEPDFDARGWKQGAGGFGNPEKRSGDVGTSWTTSDLWMRRTFRLSGAMPQQPYLLVYHDDQATVYLNGQKIADLEGWTRTYVVVPLGEEAQATLQQGQNTLALHVRQKDGGQYIDVALVDAVEEEAAQPAGAEAPRTSPGQQ